MQTRKFFIGFIAACTLLFAACEKDNEEQATPQAKANELIIDGTTYHMNGGFMPINADMGVYVAGSEEKDDYGEPLVSMVDFHIYREFMLNKTIDLTQVFPEWPGYFMIFTGAVNWQFKSYQVNDETYIGGTIEGEQYNNTPAFKSGTLKISLSGNVMTITVFGETMNGHTIDMKLVCNEAGWTSK